MDSSHDELLSRAIRGDRDALAQLLERTAGPIHEELERKIAPRYRGLVEADDVIQVTFLEVFLRIAYFSPANPGSFAGWMRRISENNLRDAIRELERDKRPAPGQRVHASADEESYVAFIERIAAVSRTPSRSVAAREVKQLLESALAQLPPDYEQALRLYELEALSGPEVADRMGRSHGAVRMLLARARDRLAELIGSDTRFFSRA